MLTPSSCQPHHHQVVGKCNSSEVCVNSRVKALRALLEDEVCKMCTSLWGELDFRKLRRSERPRICVVESALFMLCERWSIWRDALCYAGWQPAVARLRAAKHK